VGGTPDAPDPDEMARLDAVAQAVEGGRDGIAVPSELVEEVEAPFAPAVESLLSRLRDMPVSERIKLAMRGNKEARIRLLRDSNRIIVRLVLQNPRITEEEIVAITHNRTADEELLRLIALRREWTKSLPIRLGLIENPRTPTAIALRFLPTLGDRDIRRLAKSKNVPDAVTGAARRTLAIRQARGK
jgi:hypothetical protein